MRSVNLCPGRFAFHLTLLIVSAIALSQAKVPSGWTQTPVVRGPGSDLSRQLHERRKIEAEAKSRIAAAVQLTGIEQTPNQTQYDVTHYDLDFNLNTNIQILVGVATIRARVTSGFLTTMDLDLHSKMGVTSVTAGGSPASFSRPGNLITVTLDRTYSVGELIEVVVTYSGDPAGSYFRWDTEGSQDMIWTLSEPYGAREWWPCKDVNTDKADSVDIRITVPDHLTAVSNGLLISNVDNGATRTFHWKTRYPMVPYLVSLAIHPYMFYNDWYVSQGQDSMEVQFYVFASRFAAVQTNYALTVPMITTFAQSFGEYPFVAEKYGHADFLFGGAMEHQTCSSMGGWSVDLISHELGHQWWGNDVTCADFSHVWLNEGFATWSEAYWQEQVQGFEVYKNYMEAASFFGPGTIIVENPGSTSAIFDVNLTYNKSSWVVHMLRGVLGDSLFFAGLANYRSTYSGGSATTEQFRDAMEAASGMDLDTFFNQWIYGEYFPLYRTSWSQNGGTLDLTIEQRQTTGLFEMPVDIRVVTDADTIDYRVDNSLAVENYQLAVSGTVQLVTLDPDGWILHQLDNPVIDPPFDRGILVVNGVDWDTYGTELSSAYEDSVFWGGFDFDFWDALPEPTAGYPFSLPALEGTKAVPAEVLGRYSTVVWLGNNWNGDLTRWHQTPIESYLRAGGNVLLITRFGQSFLDPDFTDYLGISWAVQSGPVMNFTSAYPGLINMTGTASQSANDLFFTNIAPQSTLLFQDLTTFGAPRGVGVHAKPDTGGTYRSDGGRLVYLAARPYRLDHTSLRANVEFILSNFFGEPYQAVSVDPPIESVSLQLSPNFPNPFSQQTVISFTLPAAGEASLVLYDAAGRRIRTLVSGVQPAGRQQIRWDGTDGKGRFLSSGYYFARLESAAGSRVRSLVLIR